MVAAELSFSAKDSLQIPATGGFLTFSFLLPLASADRKMLNGASFVEILFACKDLKGTLASMLDALVGGLRKFQGAFAGAWIADSHRLWTRSGGAP